MNSKAVYAILMVYVGCGLNNVFLEYLVKAAPGSGHLITIAQFLFITVHGLIFTSKFGTVKRNIAAKDYAILVTMFFVTSVFNNWAFSFNIPVPLHMIFRAGSLIANMIMGIIILRKKYTLSKYISVAMITAGIILCTFISSNDSKMQSCSNCDTDAINNSTNQSEENFFWWVIGIVILTSALLLSARMGIYQESIGKRYGKHPEEAMYYSHLLSLPGFLIYYKSIWEHIIIFNESEATNIPILNVEIPILCIYLIGNVFTQYLCISSVYVLTTEVSSLTLTLVITLRKFLSLLFSIIYFDNPFTIGHWIGTSLVFVGTLIFTEVISRVQDSFKIKEKTT